MPELDRCLRLLALIAMVSSAAAGRPAAAASWISVGPEGGAVSLVRVAPAEPRTLYAASATGGGVFRSTDRGSHWTAASGDLPDLWIGALAVDPRDPAGLWAAVQTTGDQPARVFHSTNAGAHWADLSAGLPELAEVHLLEVDPNEPSRLWAGTRGFGLYRRDGRDDDRPWRLAGLAGENVQALAFSPADPRLLVAGTTFGAFRSADGGETWGRIAALGTQAVTGLALGRTVPGALVVLLDKIGNQLMRSVDGGLTWTASPQPYVEGVTGLATAPDGAIWTLGFGRLARSLDGGASWELAAVLPDELAIQSLAFDPQRPEIRYAGSPEGFLRTRDGGHWVLLNTGLAATHSYLLAADPFSPFQVWTWNVEDVEFGLLRTRNAGAIGATWQPADLGLSTGTRQSFRALTVDPRRPGTLYAFSGDDLYRTRNGGASWQRFGYPGSYHSDVLTVDPVHPDTLWAGGRETTDPYDRTHCLAMKSIDGGRTWRCFSGLQFDAAVAIDPQKPDTVYILSEGQIWKTVNGGRAWKPVGSGLPDGILTLAVDPSRTGFLYAGTTEGVFKSGDGGLTWRPFSNGLPEGRVTTVIVNPRQPSVVYAGVVGLGIYRSPNGGRTWAPAGDHLPSPAFAGTFALSGGAGETLYAATRGRGVWKLVLALREKRSSREGASLRGSYESPDL
jgi:photosystem II stability/assembly factor-like uncharacterized protein